MAISPHIEKKTCDWKTVIQNSLLSDASLQQEDEVLRLKGFHSLSIRRKWAVIGVGKNTAKQIYFEQDEG